MSLKTTFLHTACFIYMVSVLTCDPSLWKCIALFPEVTGQLCMEQKNQHHHAQTDKSWSFWSHREVDRSWTAAVVFISKPNCWWLKYCAEEIRRLMPAGYIWFRNVDIRTNMSVHSFRPCHCICKEISIQITCVLAFKLRVFLNLPAKHTVTINMSWTVEPI